MQNLSYCTAGVNEISALADKPNAAGMTAAQLKEKFDASGTAIKAYINETLVPHINETIKPTVEANVVAKHTHENKSLLDSYTQTEAALAEAVTKKHAHDNMGALDSYTKTMTALLGEVYTQAKLDAYPVGSIYLSVTETSPAELFGGTWERLKDVFLLAAGDTYAAGATGGEATHTLTVDEMPSHTHSLNTKYEASTTGTASNRVALADKSGNDWTQNGAVGKTGGDAAHNNMPPYLAVYMWKRTA